MYRLSPLVVVPLLALSLAAASVDGAAAAGGEAAIYEDVTAASGLDFRAPLRPTGEYHFPEIMGAGGALLDYDGDGDLDVYLVQGAVLAPARRPSSEFPPPPGAPLPTGCSATTSQRARTAPCASTTSPRRRLAGRGGYGMGSPRPTSTATATRPLRHQLRTEQLWRNRGDGTFEDVTGAAGVGDPRWSSRRPSSTPTATATSTSTSATTSTTSSPTTALHRPRGAAGLLRPAGLSAAARPPAAQPRRRHLRGRHRPPPASTAAGGRRLGVVAGDFDGDGWPDLYVANDGRPNQLWMQPAATARFARRGAAARHRASTPRGRRRRHGHRRRRPRRRRRRGPASSPTSTARPTRCT